MEWKSQVSFANVGMVGEFFHGLRPLSADETATAPIAAAEGRHSQRMSKELPQAEGPANMRKPLLSIEEASRLLGVRVNTLYCWIALRKIPHYKIGRLVKFKGDEIARWIDEKYVNAGIE